MANHQIRCLRPLLIQDTVEFEQAFFMKKIALRKIDIEGAHSWFQATKSVFNNEQPDTSSSQRDMWVFFKGFTDLLLPSKMGVSIPDTFMFDEERIIKLRAFISDAINFDICVRLQETQSTATLLASLRSPLRPRFPTPRLAIYNGTMKSPTLDKVGHFRTRQPNKQISLDNDPINRP